jgi:hypothetical protein
MALPLEVSEQRFIRSLLRSADSKTSAAVVLVGSGARYAASTSFSDIDIVTVGLDPHTPAPPRIQIVALTEDALRTRVIHGDDFAQWALRYGKPLAGRAYWHRLQQELLPGAPWPNHEAKRVQAARRLKFAEELASMDDAVAAVEELRFALSHLARGELLRHAVFPLARAELPAQLRTIGDSELADSLEKVGGDAPVKDREISSLLQFSRKRLEGLS